MTGRKLKMGPEAGPSKKMKTDDGDWRLKSSGLTDIVKVMLEKKISTDIILKLGSGAKTDELECHSFVLCGYSNVFETMLSERWIDKDSISESSKKILTLVGDDPEYFSYFLKTMYSDWNELDYTSYTNNPNTFTPAICVGVLELATKYLAHDIVKRMRHFILCILYERSVEKTVDLLVLLEQLPMCDYGGPGYPILNQVMKCILGDAANIFASRCVAKLRSVYLKKFVKSDRLQCPEDVVFSGCIRWATEQCRLTNLPPVNKNLRDVLGEILNYIRFHLMDDETLTDKVIASDILNLEEVKELFAYKINTGCGYLKDHILRFPMKKRNSPNKLQFRRLKSKMVSEENKDFSAAHGFEMTISETLRLNGMYFYCGDVTAKYDCKLDLTYVEYKILPQRVSCKTVVRSPSANNRFFVSFKNKIVLPKETPILFQFTITGGNTHFSKEDVPESTNEIVVWNNRSIVLTFKKPTSLPNGLRQAPLIIFSNP